MYYVKSNYIALVLLQLSLKTHLFFSNQYHSKEEVKISQMQPKFLFVINREECLECNKSLGKSVFVCCDQLSIIPVSVMDGI